MIPDDQIAIRLLLSAALGAVIGFERERQNQPAGLRTHIVLAIGSTLAMMLSIALAVQFAHATGGTDPARLAAQVVSGIGFLGAGAILRFGTNIKGLTTAASLWTMAMIGLTIGAGYYYPAVGTAVLLLFTLTLLNVLEKRWIRAYTNWTVTFQAVDRPDLVDEFHTAVIALDQKVKTLGFTKDVADNLMTIEATILTVENENVDRLVEQLSAMPGARQVRIHA